jgi:predicted membrane chloride channel (bestrophin family)
MDAAAYLIMAMQDRPDRIASALGNWLQQHEWNTEQLLDYLMCSNETLERLALVARPRLGADWDDDIEIIAISLHINHTALRTILGENEAASAREFGA